MRWCVLTACRSNEARGARWSEFSFDGVPTWTIPSNRMKGSRPREREPHRVPLPPAALELLARAYYGSAQLVRAEESLSRLVDMSPADGWARRALARTLERQSRSAEAAVHHRIADALGAG